MKKSIILGKLAKVFGLISVVGYIYPIGLAYHSKDLMTGDSKADLQLYIDNYFNVDTPQFIVALFFGLLSLIFCLLYLRSGKVKRNKKATLEKPINIITSSIFNVAFSLGITSLFEITNNLPTMIAIGIITEIMTLIAYKEEIKALIKSRNLNRLSDS
ncbi:TPA: hypothetical protein OW273_005187 [Citrobacter freundii]|nr:hypothetical protein [Citrobacter freundii]HCW0690491.1 hypothetical protein [Citrobacter freundii]